MLGRDQWQVDICVLREDCVRMSAKLNGEHVAGSPAQEWSASASLRLLEHWFDAVPEAEYQVTVQVGGDLKVHTSRKQLVALWFAASSICPSCAVSDSTDEH